MKLILLGLPGAGKGTQAKMIAGRLALVHVSTGDMFREAAAEGTALGKRAQQFMSRGELVPDEVTIEMLLERIARPDAQAGFMLDGFPRTLAQAQALDAALARRGAAIDAVLYIQVPEAELLGRLAGRLGCPQCGAIYHLQNRPPRRAGRCDECGSELTKRADDRAETVAERLRVNREQTEALVGYYAPAGKLHRVDGTGEPAQVTGRLLLVPDALSAEVQKA
ncbi:MAG: adenylate kinase [Dehalococcoidia bacterium]|nr:adenylate kinase [Dehalococcoidia bacterium]